jgi:MFS transporter, ACS family, D-galactonate transporter
MLLFSRTLVGIGKSAHFPVATKVVRDHFAENQHGLATGLYLAGLRLGYALTPRLMIWLMLTFGGSSHPDWRAAFLVTGLGSLVWILIWFATYQETKPSSNRKTAMRGTSHWAI